MNLGTPSLQRQAPLVPWHRRAPALALLVGLACAAGGAVAGTVEVNFQGAEAYTDTGRHTVDREQALKTLQTHFGDLGARLPAQQHLTITVTDVDLAGDMNWTRSGQDIRVLRGRTDWPRMRLSYVLREGERELTRGEAQLSDPSYLQFGGGLQRHVPLPYEKRMIDRWFQDTLSPTAAP
ncbi:MAG: DUF3016 domain-containing protein [Rubrivivax sp.]|jgi:hypothetical protein